jgi:hypothetical protein
MPAVLFVHIKSGLDSQEFQRWNDGLAFVRYPA